MTALNVCFFFTGANQLLHMERLDRITGLVDSI